MTLDRSAAVRVPPRDVRYVYTATLVVSLLGVLLVGTSVVLAAFDGDSTAFRPPSLDPYPTPEGLEIEAPVSGKAPGHAGAVPAASATGPAPMQARVSTGDPLPVVLTAPPYAGACERLFPLILAVAGQRGVPPHLLVGLAEDESSCNPHAIGESGEQGLLQLMPDTTAWCGRATDPFDEYSNLDCGARWLFASYARFGSWEDAVLAHKVGPERVAAVCACPNGRRLTARALERAETYR